MREIIAKGAQEQGISHRLPHIITADREKQVKEQKRRRRKFLTPYVQQPLEVGDHNSGLPSDVKRAKGGKRQEGKRWKWRKGKKTKRSTSPFCPFPLSPFA